ncbi:hypothetical protein Tco_1351272 [Tanacetum coccineum]
MVRSSVMKCLRDTYKGDGVKRTGYDRAGVEGGGDWSGGSEVSDKRNVDLGKFKIYEFVEKQMNIARSSVMKCLEDTY